MRERVTNSLSNEKAVKSTVVRIELLNKFHPGRNYAAEKF